jgi:glucosamine-phosphate N-acetyltransferase
VGLSAGAAMELHISEMTAPDLTEGFLEALASLTEVGLTPREALEVFRKRLKAGIRTYIAKSGDRVIGTASLLFEQKFIHKGGTVGHIEDVAVHQEFQRKGIGTALVAHCTEEAKKLGCYKVILNCFENLVPFYSRIGYHRQDVGLRYDCRPPTH